jgi:hypothetical protein
MYVCMYVVPSVVEGLHHKKSPHAANVICMEGRLPLSHLSHLFLGKGNKNSPFRGVGGNIGAPSSPRDPRLFPIDVLLCCQLSGVEMRWWIWLM